MNKRIEIKRQDLLAYLNQLLKPSDFSDVAENGLQIEGKSSVQKVVCGVSANLALIEKAIDLDADAIFVHHGLVWGGGIRRIDGWLKKRVGAMVKANINLFAYHLPLDAHPQLGNNAGLRNALELIECEPFGTYKGQKIGVCGSFKDGVSFSELGNLIFAKVGSLGAAFGDPHKPIRKIAICSGGAPELLYEAIDVGADAYLTGEPTEWVKSVAEESGVAFFAAGHHATERFGPRAIAESLRADLGIDAEFVDVPNPI